MEELNKFVNELKETLEYSEKAEIVSKKYGENLWLVQIKGVYRLWLNTLNILTKWKILSINLSINGYYEIIIGF